MTEAFRPAPEALRPFVRSLWFHRAAPVRRYERILPQPVAHLIVNLSAPYRLLRRGRETVGDPFAGAFVSGLQREYLVIENPDDLWQCGAEIEPTGIAALVAGEPRDLAGRVCDAAGLVAGSELWRDRLRREDDAEATLDALETLLVAALRPERAAEPRAAAAVARLDADPDLPIAVLATELGVSNARLIDAVRRGIGTTPKAYADLVRFSRFLGEIPFDESPPRWSDLVARTGYYDQPHFIRSFKRYTGYTPTEYLDGIRRFGAEWPAFVPMDDAG
jgi:AraC-like DNA-binding protein